MLFSRENQALDDLDGAIRRQTIQRQPQHRNRVSPIPLHRELPFPVCIHTPTSWSACRAAVAFRSINLTIAEFVPYPCRRAPCFQGSIHPCLRLNSNRTSPASLRNKFAGMYAASACATCRKTVAPRCFIRRFIGPSGWMLRTYRDVPLGAMAQRSKSRSKILLLWIDITRQFSNFAWLRDTRQPIK